MLSFRDLLTVMVQANKQHRWNEHTTLLKQEQLHQTVLLSGVSDRKPKSLCSVTFSGRQIEMCLTDWSLKDQRQVQGLSGRSDLVRLTLSAGQPLWRKERGNQPRHKSLHFLPPSPVQEKYPPTPSYTAH